MNAAARALAQGVFSTENVKTMVLSRQTLGLALLVTLVLLSALAVVYVKDLNRRLIGDFQALQQSRDTLQVEWGQLLLEENTWSTQARVQQIAQQKLDMVVPATQAVTVITLSKHH